MAPNSDTPQGAPSGSLQPCILVVEDEFLIRMMVGEELGDAGYDVIEAASADEALVILNSPARIDLVLSDVRMPGAIDGLGLLAAVTSAFPALPVILISGHLEPAIAIAHGAIRFVAKPFSLGSVVASVRAELGREQ